jgi:uncharacterized protein YprB with RNaseH-like and TPR domain
VGRHHRGHASPLCRGSPPRAARSPRSDLERHFDLYAHADRTVRFPIPELRLKDISSYLELERASVVTDGFNAVQLYGRMGWEPDPARRAILQARLTDDLAEDVDGLVKIARRFERGFPKAEPPRATRG